MGPIVSSVEVPGPALLLASDFPDRKRVLEVADRGDPNPITVAS